MANIDTDLLMAVTAALGGCHGLTDENTARVVIPLVVQVFVDALERRAKAWKEGKDPEARFAAAVVNGCIKEIREKGGLGERS